MFGLDRLVGLFSLVEFVQGAALLGLRSLQCPSARCWQFVFSSGARGARCASTLVHTLRRTFETGSASECRGWPGQVQHEGAFREGGAAGGNGLVERWAYAGRPVGHVVCGLPVDQVKPKPFAASV